MARAQFTSHRFDVLATSTLQIERPYPHKYDRNDARTTAHINCRAHILCQSYTSRKLRCTDRLRFPQIYISCLLGFVPFSPKIQEDVIPVVRAKAGNVKVHWLTPNKLPFWALISFGAFLLFKLGYGVLTFNDVPDAHAELMRQIDQARSELKKNGVEVD